MSISSAIVTAQQQMPKLLKDSEADTGKFRYKYLSLGSLLDQVLPVLNANGLALLQYPEMYEGRHTLTTELRHDSGDSVKSVMMVPVNGDAGAQAYGSALTYARRYAVLAVLALAPDEDDDGAAASEREPRESGHDRRPGANTPSRSEAALPATEKPAGSGQLAQINTTLKLLNDTFPNHPGEGRTWQNVAKEFCIDKFIKDSAADLTMAEAVELNDYLEQQYQEARQEAETGF